MKHYSIPSACRHALKEWAVVCAAIEQGRQHLLFRTGGIHESTGGFQPEQNSFWLYPTKFHQTSELVTEEFGKSDSLDLIDSQNNDTDTIRFKVFCRVTGVYFVDCFEKLELLRQFHVLKDEVLKMRFEYRNPGLFAITVSPFVLPQPFAVPHQSRFDGCKSWVEFDDAFPTSLLQPVNIEGQVSPQEVAQTVGEALS